MTEKRAMLIWRIGKIATSSVTVEEADTWEQACRKAGWEPEDCEVADITESLRVLVAGGDLQIIKGTPIFNLQRGKA